MKFDLATVALALAVGAGVSACDGGAPFTDDELTVLRTFRLEEASLPYDDSNLYADDVAAAQLGKRFFFDRQIGGPLGPFNDGTTDGSLGPPGSAGRVSCADCHQLDEGGSDHRSGARTVSLGAGYSLRNASTVINAAFSPKWQFWDGRKDSLWSQALGPVESAGEVNGTRLAIAHLIQDQYRPAYEAVFGPMLDLSDSFRFPIMGKPGDGVFDRLTTDDQDAVNRAFANFGKALAAYERRLISPAFAPSPLDTFLAGDTQALSPAAIRGARLFMGRAGCMECHRGPLLTDFGFHNVGTPQGGAHVPAIDLGRFSGLQALAVDPFERRGRYSDVASVIVGTMPTAPDSERVPVPQLTDVGRFKTPTLRNVEKTAPYMHDGIYPTLADVVRHYNMGGDGDSARFAGEKDPAISPLLLTAAEIDDLVEFLRALSDGPARPDPDFPEGLIAEPR